jgi:hypothetical protein
VRARCDLLSIAQGGTGLSSTVRSGEAVRLTLLYEGEKVRCQQQVHSRDAI